MRTLLIIFVALTSFGLQAKWQTIKTENFNVHYPQPLQHWAYSAANELEVVREKVLAQQGRALNERADVIIYDPDNAANGFALPSTDKPMMALLATPPQSDSVIANNTSWQQLLILHEYIHLVHLSQPSRNQWRQQIRDWHDITDLLDAVLPRWVSEGYATLLESRLTGRGRLYDNYSESIVRYYAQQGALPTYAALNNGDKSYLSNSMAYLVGVRFLAWLEDNYGAQTLDAVWTRVQAVQSRRFESAFSGAFGAPASQLYRRFVVEYSYQAMQQELALPPVESELWQQFAYGARDIVLSPDRSRFLAVEQDRKRRVTLNIYETKPNEEAIKQFNERKQAVLAADPNDIPDIAPDVFPKKRLLQLNAHHFGGIYYPQWLDDKQIYFVAKTPTSNNTFINDLFVWQSDTGTLKQLTQSAGIRRFSIMDANTIVAEVSRQGYSQLVKIALDSGKQTPITEAILGDVYDFPVLAKNKKTLAYVHVSPNKRWQLAIKDLVSGSVDIVYLPKSHQYLAALQWSYDDGSLYFISGIEGHLTVMRYNPASKLLETLPMSAKPLRQVLVDSQKLFISYATPEGVKIEQLVAPSWHAVSVLEQVDSAEQKAHHPYQLPAAKIDQTAQPASDYSMFDQSYSVALSGALNSASFDNIGVALKGQDVLRQLSWQLGLEKSINNGALLGGFAQLEYHQHNWETTLDVGYQNLEADKQSSLILSEGDTTRFKQFALSSSYRFGDMLNYLKPELGVVRLQQGSESWHGGRYGVNGRMIWDAQQHGAAVQVVANQWLGELDGFDYRLNLFAKAWHVPFYAVVDSRYSGEVPISIGGGALTSTSVSHKLNVISEPMLPHLFASGSRYLGYEFATSWQQGRPKLFYKQHQLDGEVIGQNYGIKMQLPLSKVVLDKAADFAPAGLTDLQFSAGVGRVEGHNMENENRVWFSIWYEL
ncbi:TolB family protein [Pseudoalteromonas piscicida]|uniref:Uncharacterized protein n=1 Tax=Pseudoalteromonas piscicida TaxID=43662 RepID=A0A2A5JMU0_PSEO7|nr:hypothetical protein [Pseudoalteromonas piscicida]PCK30677.1 hypothetical protein CEX98_16130 [Pseudoalteromonas piscicida]